MDSNNDTEISENNLGVVSVDVLAKLLGLTTRRIQQLAADGVIPKGGVRGEYVLAGSVRGYINYLQKDGVIDDRLATEKLMEEITNLKLKNKKLHVANEKESNDLVYISEARGQMAMIAEIGLRMLENLTDILERDFQLDAEIIANIEAHVDIVREQWAQYLEQA